MVQVPLDKIISIGFHFNENDDELALLVLDIAETPKFFNRRINCDDEERNQYRQRQDFTPKQVASRVARHFILADEFQLQQTLGIMFEVMPELKQLIDAKGIDEEPARLSGALFKAEKKVKREIDVGGEIGADGEDDDEPTGCTIEEVTDDEELDSDSDELSMN